MHGLLATAWREYADCAANLHGLALCVLGPYAVAAAVVSARLGRAGPVLLAATLVPAFLVFSVGYVRATRARRPGSAYMGPRQMLRLARRRLQTTLVAGVAAGALVGAGAQLRVLPGLLLVGLVWPLAGVLVTERRGPLESIARAATLLHRDLPATLALGTTFAASAYGVVVGVGHAAAALGEPAAGALATAVACALVAPPAAVVFRHGHRAKARGARLSLRPPLPAERAQPPLPVQAVPEPATEPAAASSSAG